MATKKLPKTKYDPSMLDVIIELGKQGASQKTMWSTLGISKSTAETWKKNNPDFAEALDLALVHSQAHYERLMLANVENKNFNSRLVEVILRGQFQQDYRERVDIKQDIKKEVTIDFNKVIDDLIKDLEKDDDEE